MNTNNDAEKIAREIANEICNHTFIDPALPTWKAIITKHIAPLVQERDELRATLRVGTALENCNLLKDNAEIRAQLERAKGALAFYASLQTYLGAISKFDGDYRDISDEFGIEYYLPGKLADATLAELSTKDSATEPPSGQATKIPEPPAA